MERKRTGSLEHGLRRINLQHDAPESGVLRGQQFGVGIERALGQLSREPDKSGVGEQLCKTQRGLAALSPTQNQSAGFDLNAWIPAWDGGSSGRQIPGRN